jgi:hydrogenase expression/formation protein HypE
VGVIRQGELSLNDFAKALCRGACVIGEVKAGPRGMVVLETVFGGTRIVDMLVSELAPRIC